MRAELAVATDDEQVASLLAACCARTASRPGSSTTPRQRLVTGATIVLHRLSNGAYSLVLDGKDFVVIDHLNAEGRGPVGGETFLASRGGALALADQVVELAGTAAAPLEIAASSTRASDARPRRARARGCRHRGARQPGRAGRRGQPHPRAGPVPVRFEVRKGPGRGHRCRGSSPDDGGLSRGRIVVAGYGSPLARGLPVRRRRHAPGGPRCRVAADRWQPMDPARASPRHRGPDRRRPPDRPPGWCGPPTTGTPPAWSGGLHCGGGGPVRGAGGDRGGRRPTAAAHRRAARSRRHPPRHPVHHPPAGGDPSHPAGLSVALQQAMAKWRSTWPTGPSRSGRGRRPLRRREGIAARWGTSRPTTSPTSTRVDTRHRAVGTGASAAPRCSRSAPAGAQPGCRGTCAYPVRCPTPGRVSCAGRSSTISGGPSIWPIGPPGCCARLHAGQGSTGAPEPGPHRRVGEPSPSPPGPRRPPPTSPAGASCAPSPRTAPRPAAPASSGTARARGARAPRNATTGG